MLQILTENLNVEIPLHKSKKKHDLEFKKKFFSSKSNNLKGRKASLSNGGRQIVLRRLKGFVWSLLGCKHILELAYSNPGFSQLSSVLLYQWYNTAFLRAVWK